jgi:hypothetical protein
MRAFSAANLGSRPLSEGARRWVALAVRLGCLTHGVVYGLIGVLALLAALGRSGGRMTDGHGAVHKIAQSSWGEAMIWAVAIGLACYSLWSLVRALFDPERVASHGKAVLHRVGYAASAGSHALLSVHTFQLALGAAHGGGSERTIAHVLDLPGGRIAIAIAGASIFIYGLVELHSAYRGKVGHEFAGSALSAQRRRVVMQVARLGRGARGIVFPIIGVSLIIAALEARAHEAKSFGEALRELAAAPFGTALQLIVALGLIAYALFMFCVAGYARPERHM